MSNLDYESLVGPGLEWEHRCRTSGSLASTRRQRCRTQLRTAGI